jgi:hypothetical protein
MKKTFVVLLALLCVTVFAFAAGKAAPTFSDKPLFAPGNITIQAGLGSGFFNGFDLYGGAEYGIGQFTVANKIPLTYGAAARVGYYGWTDSYNYYTVDYDESYHYLSISAFGTVHVSWKDVLPDVKWLSRVESYVGLGLGTYFYGWSYDYSYSGFNYKDSANDFNFGFASLEGNNFYITPSIAINLEGGYYGYGGAGRLGVVFKL